MAPTALTFSGATFLEMLRSGAVIRTTQRSSGPLNEPSVGDAYESFSNGCEDSVEGLCLASTVVHHEYVDDLPERSFRNPTHYLHPVDELHDRMTPGKGGCSFFA